MVSGEEATFVCIVLAGGPTPRLPRSPNPLVDDGHRRTRPSLYTKRGITHNLRTQAPMMGTNTRTHACTHACTHTCTHARTKTNERVLALCQGAVEVRCGVDESAESWDKQWFATPASPRQPHSVEYIALLS